MRRFNYEEDDEYREDVENFFNKNDDNEDEDEDEELTQEEYQALVEQDQALKYIQIEFDERDMNHRTLKSAIAVCEKWIWWRFCSQITRVKMIEKTYRKFKRLEDKNANL